MTRDAAGGKGNFPKQGPKQGHQCQSLASPPDEALCGGRVPAVPDPFFQYIGYGAQVAGGVLLQHVLDLQAKAEYDEFGLGRGHALLCPVWTHCIRASTIAHAKAVIEMTYKSRQRTMSSIPVASAPYIALGSGARHRVSPDQAIRFLVARCVAKLAKNSVRSVVRDADQGESSTMIKRIFLIYHQAFRFAEYPEKVIQRISYREH